MYMDPPNNSVRFFSKLHATPTVHIFTKNLSGTHATGCYNTNYHMMRIYHELIPVYDSTLDQFFWAWHSHILYKYKKKE